MKNKLSNIFQESGYVGLVKRITGYLYRNTLRRIMPIVGPVRYAGIPVSMDRKWGDLRIPEFMAPFMIHDIPEYEETLIRGIRTNVHQGDKVVIVGGGEGVTVTVAAKAVGDTGSVICFEGARDCADRVLKTASRNGVASRVSIRHAIVGTNFHVYGDGDSRTTEIVAPHDLPDCDVLELDCEGAETLILENMRLFPRTILVETHGVFGF